MMVVMDRKSPWELLQLKKYVFAQGHVIFSYLIDMHAEGAMLAFAFYSEIEQCMD